MGVALGFDGMLEIQSGNYQVDSDGNGNNWVTVSIIEL